MPGQEAKYQQIIDWVRENIRNGTLRHGDKLMSENELAHHFGLSRQTIRRATGELENMNLVTRVRGSGTYINTDGNGLSEEQPEQMVLRDAPAAGPHTAAREKSGNIAVISTFNERYIFPDILKGIEGVLTENGYTMQVAFTDNRLSREREILQQLLMRDNIDGLIVEPVKSALPNPNLDYYKRLRRRVPVIFFNAVYPGGHMPCVRIDDRKTGQMAVQYLLVRGHRKIGGIFKSDDGQGPLRYQGYLDAMIAAGAPVDQQSVVWLDTPAAASISDVGDYIFRRLHECSAVVCYNDQIAYQLVNLALARGIRIPEDLSVIGVDDSYLADVSRIPITSFLHPKKILGEKTAENMMQLIRDPSFDADYLFESTVVERSSVIKI